MKYRALQILPANGLEKLKDYKIQHYKNRDLIFIAKAKSKIIRKSKIKSVESLAFLMFQADSHNRDLIKIQNL